MWSTMHVSIGSEASPTEVDIGVFCGWETASSQIRICIVLSAIYTVFLSYRSVINESKSLADRFLNSSQLFAFLLCITGLFDFLSIYDSINDNYGLCIDPELKDLQIHSTLKSFNSKCSTGIFGLVGCLMIISSLGMWLTAAKMKEYRKFISIDSL